MPVYKFLELPYNPYLRSSNAILYRYAKNTCKIRLQQYTIATQFPLAQSPICNKTGILPLRSL